MHTSENASYPVQGSGEYSPHELQVYPIKSYQSAIPQHSLASSGKKQRASSNSRKRRRARLQWKCAVSASVILLTAAAGSVLYLLNTSTNPLQKISSPAFFSDLDSGHQQLTATDQLGKSKKRTQAGTQKGALHITSFSEKWNLILVNPWNPVPDDYQVDLVSIQSGHYIDARCYPNLQAMLTDCYNAGLSPLICSSYRTQEMQQELFDERIDELLAQGYSMEDAYDKAATSVARPGTSEHQIGLAVDIVDKNHQMLDSSQEQTPVQQWLIENSWKYGFILRYPNGTSELTGIIYEPWHYRYVGKKTAKKIHKQSVCLEEYLAGLLD